MARLIPLAVMESLLKQAGAARVSEESKQALKEAVEQYALKLGEESVKLAKHAERRTILGRDIRLAKERL